MFERDEDEEARDAVDACAVEHGAGVADDDGVGSAPNEKASIFAFCS